MNDKTAVRKNSASLPLPAGVEFGAGHHFVSSGQRTADAVPELAAPLSVILQVTKRCDFDCSFCSETLQMPDPSLEDLDKIRGNLSGVSRVFLSGGEPLLRRDILEVVSLFESFIVGLPTNASRATRVATKLAGRIAFANIGFDGPRGVFRRVRADGYDRVLRGVKDFVTAGIPISFSAVVYRSTLHGLPYLLQIADVLEAGKVKLILPLRKGNALGLKQSEFITNQEAAEAFERLVELRTLHEWVPALRLTTWNEETEGHMIVIEPNGVARAWPVYNEPNLWLEIGNLLKEPIADVWERYPFKSQHAAKYLGRSIHTAMRQA